MTEPNIDNSSTELCTPVVKYNANMIRYDGFDSIKRVTIKTKIRRVVNVENNIWIKIDLEFSFLLRIFFGQINLC